MTIEEAKKIIDMCADAVKKGDGEDAKIYVNKEYVLSILDMVERTPQITWPDDPYPYPWYPTQPWTHPTDPGVTWKDRFIYKKTTDGTGDDAPGKWIPCRESPANPLTPYCTTGSDEELRRLREITTADSSQNTENITAYSSISEEPTNLYKEKFTTAGKVRETSEGTHTV